MAAKHEAFSRTEEANSLQFSLTVEVLPSNNLRISSICKGSKYQVEVARNSDVWRQKMDGFRKLLSRPALHNLGEPERAPH